MSRSTTFTVLPFFLSLFVVLFFVFPKFPGNLINWDSNPTILTPIVLQKYHSFYFDQMDEGKKKLAVERTDLDSYYYLVVNAQNHVVSGYPIMSGVLMIPFFAIASLLVPQIWSITSFPHPTLISLGSGVAAFLTVLSSYFLFRVIKDRTKSLLHGLLGAIIFVFATPVISVSSRFVWQHTFALFFLSLMLYLFHKKKYLPVLLVALLSILCRPQTLLLTLPFVLVTLYSRYREKKLLVFKTEDYLSAFLASLILVFQLYYSSTYLGNAFKLAPLYDPSYFSANIFLGLSGILFSPAKGVFAYSPIFFFSILFLLSSLKRRFNSEYLLFALGLAMFTFITGMWKAWMGGWSLGYRLMLETVPFLVILTTDMLHHHRPAQNLKSLLILMALGISIIFNTQIIGIWGECGYHGVPTNIDRLQGFPKLRRVWLDSPIWRCIKQLQVSATQ